MQQSSKPPLPVASTSPGLFTICVLCYGDHSSLAERFLASLYRYTDPRFFSLRAGLNAVVPATEKLFEEHRRQHGNVQVTAARENLFKSPMMRRMFREQPLTTEWVIWFDDDSFPTRSDWLQRLALQIARTPQVAQWGRGFVLWRRDSAIEQFVTESRWYRGLPLRRGPDLEGTEAFRFEFATGGFWALKTEVIHRLDWPDPRIVQANDDFLLGEALRQNSYHCGNFEYGIRINDHPRRNADAPEVCRLPQMP